jgi:glycosyltransferase involved in cell wall biosynthesis
MTIVPTIESYQQLQPSLDRQEGGLKLKSPSQQMPTLADSDPLVSIITVVYNGEKVIEETILSVLNQTYKNIEYIIVEGCSTDRTLDIVRKYDDRISYWMSEPDSGLYDAMNKAIVLARGILVGIINAGDYYTPDAVETIVSRYREERVLGIYSGDCKSYLNNNNDKWYLFSGRCTLPDRTLPHPPTFVPLATYLEYGLFDTSFKIAADYDLLSRFYKNAVPLFHIQKTIATASAPGIAGNFYNTYIECLMVRLRHHPSITKSILITGTEFIKVTIRKILEMLNLWYLIENIKDKTVY